MKYILITLLSVVLFGCGSETESGKGGIILSFDDKSVDSWYDAISTFDAYRAKVTFFTYGYSKLTMKQKTKLKELQDAGHEIGSHSVKHLNAVDYSNLHGVDSYINDDVLPNVNAMANDGLNVSSFAFPYSESNKELETGLKQYFTKLRSGTNSINKAVSNGEGLLLAFGIDGLTYDDLYNVIEAIDYAQKNYSYILFYAHNISNNCEGKTHCVDINMIEEILNYAQSINMPFITYSDINPK